MMQTQIRMIIVIVLFFRVCLQETKGLTIKILIPHPDSPGFGLDHV